MTMDRLARLTIAAASREYPRHDGATMVELRDGRLLLAWMEHTGGETVGHDHAPCNVAAMISDDGGRTWGDHRILVRNNPGDINIHFPCLLRLQRGDILFYYQRRHELAPGAPQRSTSYVCWSGDDGATFSDPIEHTVIRNNDMSGNRLLQLRSGRILLGNERTLGDWCEEGEDGVSLDHSVAGCCYSDDDGQSWQQSAWVDLPLRGAMEPRIAELRDGRLLMFMRTQLGAVFQSESGDGGETWSKPQTTALRAPESMPGLARIPGTDDLFAIWNHGTYDPEFDHCGKRTPLTVAVSRDDGQSWEKVKDIETDPDYEFTNPSYYFTSRDTLVIAYVASKMDNPQPPGQLGRSCMPLKAVVADVAWLYG